jgi:hypothetical protein
VITCRRLHLAGGRATSFSTSGSRIARISSTAAVTSSRDTESIPVPESVAAAVMGFGRCAVLALVLVGRRPFARLLARGVATGSPCGHRHRSGCHEGQPRRRSGHVPGCASRVRSAQTRLCASPCSDSIRDQASLRTRSSRSATVAQAAYSTSTGDHRLSHRRSHRLRRASASPRSPLGDLQLGRVEVGHVPLVAVLADATADVIGDVLGPVPAEPRAYAFVRLPHRPRHADAHGRSLPLSLGRSLVHADSLAACAHAQFPDTVLMHGFNSKRAAPVVAHQGGPGSPHHLEMKRS